MLNSPPLLSLRAYQREVFWRDDLRRCGLSWKRQDGKSTTLAGVGLRRMMEHPGRLVIFSSASILLGTEFIRKEAELWQKFLTAWKEAAVAAGMQAESNADGLDVDAVSELLEHSKLETKLWHDRTRHSRSRVVAPNPDTAVGWTGDVFIDEFGRVPELQAVLEAIQPIMDNNPQFILRLATTPPPDDAHYSWELLAPEQEEFPVNPLGNWYRSAAGLLVHRHDVHDAHAAGLSCFHPDTGVPITPEEHRARQFDKAAWDRNYALCFLRGGVSAVSLVALQSAMARGAGLCLARSSTEEIAA
ncbi:MAG: hypothetical protein QM796_18375 [Chthoniobacteraceae bacterium]